MNKYILYQLVVVFILNYGIINAQTAFNYLPFEYKKEVNDKQPAYFIPVYGSFLVDYKATVDTKFSKDNDLAEISTNFNNLLATKVFSQLISVRKLPIQMPIKAVLHEFSFKTELNAKKIEAMLQKHEGDIKLSIAPYYYVFYRWNSILFFVHYASDNRSKNSKIIEDLSFRMQQNAKKLTRQNMDVQARSNLLSYHSVPVSLYKSKYVNLAIGNEFERLFGEVLAPYNKVLFDEAKRKEAIEVIAKDFNRLLKTKAFSQLMYVKRLGVKKPLELEAFEFRFSTDYSLQVVKKILDKYPADSNIGDKLAPRFFSYKCHDESIFLILHGNPTGSSGIKSMRMAFKAYFPY
jgi:hypothetical protein